jgi:transcriptional regulator GlxA family with amidase domain
VSRRIVFVTYPGITALDLVGPHEVFTAAAEVARRTGAEPDAYRVEVASTTPGPLTTTRGLVVVSDRALTSIRGPIDTLVVVGGEGAYAASQDADLVAWIRRAARRSRRVASVCTGAFLLAAAGVLDGRRATTHWMYTDRLAEMFPATEVDPDVLFVQDDKVVTGAGTAAGIDAALHIVRTELGASAANIVARRMVVPPQRDGGQSQFIQTPVAECRTDSFARVTEWMLEHLDEDLTVDRLARTALMSPRTFARKFRAETGTTPNAWLNRQRLLRAQQLLEETDLTLEEIARETGFGAAAVMRHHFVKVLQTTPTQYRRVFGPRQAG